MTKTRIALLGLLSLSPTLLADTTYRDPKGRFTIPVPAGWTQTPGEGFFKLDHGSASAFVLAIDDFQSPKDTVASVLEEIGKRWRSFKQQDGAEVRFGAQPGYSAGGFGFNPSGVQAFVVVYAAARRSEGFAMIVSAPTAEIQSINPDLQKIIEGFVIESGGAGVQPATARKITFNGRSLTPAQLARLENLERTYSARIPNGEYWYDNRTGAAGFWGGPAVAILAAGLELGGPMPANPAAAAAASLARSSTAASCIPWILPSSVPSHPTDRCCPAGFG